MGFHEIRTKTGMEDLYKWADHKDACPDALHWVKKQPKDQSLYFAWRSCPYGDWLVWLLTTIAMHKPDAIDKPRMVSMACEWVELVLPPVDHEVSQPREAIEAAREWLRSPNSQWIREAERREKALQELDHVHGKYRRAASAARDILYTIEGPHLDELDCSAHSVVGWAVPGSKKRGKEVAKIVRRHFPWSEVKPLLVGTIEEWLFNSRKGT